MTRRNSYLVRVYGITETEYLEVLEYQDNRCFVCGTPPKPGKNLHVDHDHVTGVVRGLLCYQCNKFVIGRHRDPLVLRAAAEYLGYPPAVRVLGTRVIPVPPKKKRRRKK